MTVIPVAALLLANVADVTDPLNVTVSPVKTPAMVGVPETVATLVASYTLFAAVKPLMVTGA